MPTQVEKLQGYASHLLDDFILLREKYALLEPMLFDSTVSDAWGQKQRARGFQALQKNLFTSCAQDVAKITLDRDERVPSLCNIIARLQDDGLRRELRELFAVWRMNIPEDDPVIADVLRRMELTEEAERRQQFDKLYAALVKNWEKFQHSPPLEGFKTIRDKISAHSEIRYHVDGYKRVGLGSLGLKWGDIGAAMKPLQEMVEQVGLVVRGASFAWDMLDEQLSTAADAFWGQAPA